MTQVFISYAQEDRALAEALARHLSGRGYSVWWDAKLLASDNMDDAIRNALENSKASIVIWTANSAKSLYVRDEARFALFNNKLVAVKEPQFPIVEIPFGFQSQHTEDVTELDRVEEAVKAVTPTASADLRRNDTSAPMPGAKPAITGLRAFWEGFRLNISSFLPTQRSGMAVAGAIVGTIFISLLATAFMYWMLVTLRERRVGTDIENHFAFVVLCVPWLLNVRMINQLFRQRAIWGGWILGVFWAMLTSLFAVATTYSIATLLGEADIERFAMGSRVLILVAVAGPLAALAYLFQRARRVR